MITMLLKIARDREIESLQCTDVTEYKFMSRNDPIKQKKYRYIRPRLRTI